jgi:ferritin-like metal-binding protein YciE
MKEGSTNEKLRQAFEDHLEDTREHVRRLEEIRSHLNTSTAAECKGMRGLIAEGEKVLEGEGDASVKDAAVISAAQRMEHYEIAGYGTARALADELGLDYATDLLDRTLEEESEADKLLTKIATGGVIKSGINEQAPNASRSGSSA